jgi:hypothetical protein
MSAQTVRKARSVHGEFYSMIVARIEAKPPKPGTSLPRAPVLRSGVVRRDIGGALPEEGLSY